MVKLPPQNLEAEKSVLGAILIDEEAIVQVAQILEEEHFYDNTNGIIYAVFLYLFEKNKPIDVLTVTNELKRRKLLSNVGGSAYIADLVATVPSAANVVEYAQIIKEGSIRRRLVTLGARISELALAEEKELSQVMDSAEKSLFEVTEQSVNKDFVHVSKLLEETYERAEMLSSNPEELRGISTGFGALDNVLGGFQDSDLVILAARPSVGKTALSLDFARYAAIEKGKSVGFFSLEMSNLQLMDRLLSMQVGVGLWELRMGKLTDESFSRLADAMGILSESNLFIDDTPGINILEMRTKARRLKAEKGLDLLFVDYLQLIEGRTKESRTQEVSEISRFLKGLARELNIPVIALSQLSRAIEQRADRLPQLSDLRESGSIEQDADVVMFINREEQFNPDTERKGIADIHIAKHRNGPTGVVELFFVKEQARFRPLDKKY